jgi:hypothetical protein
MPGTVRALRSPTMRAVGIRPSVRSDEAAAHEAADTQRYGQKSGADRARALGPGCSVGAPLLL